MKKKEIERKFLLTAIPSLSYIDTIQIFQFYTEDGMRYRRETHADSTVEYVKIRKEKISHGENEEDIYDCDVNEFNRHLVNSDMVIRKTRYVYTEGETKFEIDEFHGKASGLIMMEIELETIDQPFEMPIRILETLKAEVTGNSAYDNSEIAKQHIKWQ